MGVITHLSPCKPFSYIWQAYVNLLTERLEYVPVWLFAACWSRWFAYFLLEQTKLYVWECACVDLKCITTLRKIHSLHNYRGYHVPSICTCCVLWAFHIVCKGQAFFQIRSVRYCHSSFGPFSVLRVVVNNMAVNSGRCIKTK